MAELTRDESGEDGSSLYINGYFSQRIAAGDRPDYGYPTNHLPDAEGEEMEIVTGFIAACKKNK